MHSDGYLWLLSVLDIVHIAAIIYAVVLVGESQWRKVALLALGIAALVAVKGLLWWVS